LLIKIAEPLTARYILYVAKKEDGDLLRKASPEVRRQTWLQLVDRISVPSWMKDASLPLLVDRRALKGYCGGAEEEVLRGKPAEKKLDDLD